jgi:hypothetical protein
LTIKALGVGQSTGLVVFQRRGELPVGGRARYRQCEIPCRIKDCRGGPPH